MDFRYKIKPVDINQISDLSSNNLRSSMMPMERHSNPTMELDDQQIDRSAISDLDRSISFSLSIFNQNMMNNLGTNPLVMPLMTNQAIGAAKAGNAPSSNRKLNTYAGGLKC